MSIDLEAIKAEARSTTDFDPFVFWRGRILALVAEVERLQATERILAKERNDYLAEVERLRRDVREQDGFLHTQDGENLRLAAEVERLRIENATLKRIAKELAICGEALFEDDKQEGWADALIALDALVAEHQPVVTVVDNAHQPRSFNSATWRTHSDPAIGSE